MKKAFIIIACVAAMLAAGASLKAQEVTITLMPGWTWISIPSTETMDFATALGSFTPQAGDRIKSQWGNATYRGDGEWRGQISEFYPGYGYKYYSTRQVPVSVTFNAQQPSQQVVVATDTPQFITGNSAMGGGEVTVNDGTYILVKGLCWATHENPTTNEDSFVEDGSGVGSFSATMTGLNWSTTYYVRAYAVTPNGTVYGDQKTFTTRDGIPEVSTDSITNILGDGATCGGTVTDDGGMNVTARGVCWSTSHNPTVSDSHTTNGSGLGSFTSTMTGMDVSTTYYVRAYASTSAGTGYGEEESFTTQSSSVGLYVDLGLPSGTLWATCNVGAETPEDYGDYFAWGETVPKDVYNWDSYQHSNGGFYDDEFGEFFPYLTKYYTNNLTPLLPEDDAATANWGEDWRMPTWTEWNELRDNTTCIWTTQNGVNGRLFTASNGNSLFLPAAGCRVYSSLSNAGSYGYYWSSELVKYYASHSWYFHFYSGYYHVDYNDRCDGQSVRAVRCKNRVINVTANPTEGGSVSGGGTYLDQTSCTITAMANEGYVFVRWTENGKVVSLDASYSFTVNGDRDLVANFVGDHGYVDLGLPSGTLWAICNVGAENPVDYGDYFAWGETQPKDTYNWSTYRFCYQGDYYRLTKYCNDPIYGVDLFTDNLTILLPEDDAATANWGIVWRMPTKEEWQELYNNTTCTWTTENGVNGRLFTASNGNSLFLPAAGYRDDGSLYSAGSFGGYWSSSLYTDPSRAWYFYSYSGTYGMSYYHGHRYYGRSVRAVRSSAQSNVPTGAIDGKFTINSDGDQVYFSQGNLQYIGSATTPYWKFADNQWDVLGTTTDQNSSNQNVDRDLFGWGTSGYDHGANCYQPWSTSQTNSDYYAYGSYVYSLYDQTGQADWGYNPISNGGNQANQWRTLTQPEWDYVFNTRSTSSGIRYAKANVNNVNGVILLPDDWNTSIYSLSNTNSTDASYSSNTISATQWITLENAGAVFLPAAGNRDGTSVGSVGSYGYYWSASYSNSFSARSVGFYGSGLGTDNGYYRSYGFSVRLARVAE